MSDFDAVVEVQRKLDTMEKLLDATKASAKHWADSYQETKDDLLAAKRDLELIRVRGAKLCHDLEVVERQLRARWWPWVRVKTMLGLFGDPRKKHNDSEAVMGTSERTVRDGTHFQR